MGPPGSAERCFSACSLRRETCKIKCVPYVPNEDQRRPATTRLNAEQAGNHRQSGESSSARRPTPRAGYHLVHIHRGMDHCIAAGSSRTLEVTCYLARTRSGAAQPAACAGKRAKSTVFLTLVLKKEPIVARHCESGRRTNHRVTNCSIAEAERRQYEHEAARQMQEYLHGTI